MVENRRRRRQNRQNFRKKSIFGGSVFLPFFRAPKKTEKSRKKEANSGSTFRNDGPAEPGGEVRRGKLSEYGGVWQEVGTDLARQHPGGVRRIEDASARSPHPEMAGPADGVAQSGLGVCA